MFRPDVCVTEADVENRDGSDDALHLERFAEPGQTDCYLDQG